MSMRSLPALCAGAMLLAACTADPGAETPVGRPQALPLPAGPAYKDPDFLNTTIHFDTDSTSLSAEAQTILQWQTSWLQRNMQQSVTIEGHADERGTRDYNLALGERRAQAVMNYLVALGIDAKRLKTISYGKERPVCAAANEACWSQNRRTVSALDN